MDFQIKGRREKNKKQHAGYICKFCEFGHTTVPYGIGAQGHAVGTNQRGKGPPIATVMNTPHAQGRKSKNQTAGEPQGRKLQKKEFRTNREEKIKASGATYVTYCPHHGCASRRIASPRVGQ